MSPTHTASPVPEPDWASRLGLGAWTDLSVNILSGSQVEDRGDHLVLRTPENPTYLWGNCLMALDAPDDADRWLAAFDAAFPQADHVAIGLPDSPTTDVWAEHGLELSLEDVLVSDHAPAPVPAPEGLTIAPLTSDADWDQVVDLFDTENQRTREFPQPGHREFLTRRGTARRSLVAAGQACFLGAWRRDRLVGHVGIVNCGQVARYQSVLVDADERRRGLATHLVTACGAWAAEQGRHQQVIMAEAQAPAGRLYRRLGFTLSAPLAGVERFGRAT